MTSLEIRGPARISGTVRIDGNKNAVLPMIAAALLTDGKVTLRNVPDILDVRNMLECAVSVGAECRFQDGVLEIESKNIRSCTISREHSSRLRTSFLFAAPLTVRTGKARLYPPGGDVIGHRRLDSHFYGLGKLGIGFSCEKGGFLFHRKQGLHGSDIFLDEAGVTATEHILIAAVLAPGRTILRNAACEPHVTQLAELLNAMGAKIRGMGTNQLTIDGVSSLHGADFELDGDHVEAASFLSLAAACRGKITVTGKIPPRHYWMARRVFEKFNLSFRLEPGKITMEEADPRIVQDFGNAIPVISDGPWPQFPSDMMSCMIALATQSAGTVLFFEKMFESRIYFVDKLISMGANAIVCDPHRAVISGPAALHGVEMFSPDIRAGMALVIAAAAADGVSVIRKADIIFRGYANLPEKLRALGVDVRVREGK